MIDLFGKADAMLEYGPVHTPMSIEDIPFMQSGLMKWDYACSIGKLPPTLSLIYTKEQKKKPSLIKMIMCMQ